MKVTISLDNSCRQVYIQDMSSDKIIGRIERAARNRGYSVNVKIADTMSAYITCERGSDEIVIRVADHPEVYPPRRGERRVNINPEQGSVDLAIAALRNPESIPGYEPVGLTDDQREAMREQSEEDARRKQNWKQLRESLKPEWIAAFAANGRTKRAARQIAELAGIGAGRMYAALSNGKRM